MAKERIGGRDWTVKSLSRKEVRELRKAGYSLLTVEPEKLDETVDAVLEKAFPGQDSEIEGMENVSVYELFRKVLGATFGQDGAVKN